MLITVVVTLIFGSLYYIFNILLQCTARFCKILRRRGIIFDHLDLGFIFGASVCHPGNCSFYVFLMLPAVMSQFFPNFKNPSVPDPNHQYIEIHGVSVWIIICVGGCFYTVYKL